MNIIFIPFSVLGSATVTLIVQVSQQTSSTPSDGHGLRLFWSKNWTVIWPLPPLPAPFILSPFVGAPELDNRSASSWRSSAETRCSIIVWSSSSLT